MLSRRQKKEMSPNWPVRRSLRRIDASVPGTDWPWDFPLYDVHGEASRIMRAAEDSAAIASSMSADPRAATCAAAMVVLWEIARVQAWREALPSSRSPPPPPPPKSLPLPSPPSLPELLRLPPGPLPLEEETVHPSSSSADDAVGDGGALPSPLPSPSSSPSSSSTTTTTEDEFNGGEDDRS